MSQHERARTNSVQEAHPVAGKVVGKSCDPPEKSATGGNTLASSQAVKLFNANDSAQIVKDIRSISKVLGALCECTFVIEYDNLQHAAFKGIDARI